MSNLITLEFDGTPLAFRQDAWFNATQAAAKFGKRLDKYLGTDETAAYIAALCEDPNTPQRGDLIQTRRGANGGTWMHPALGVHFARWLDVRFAIWCDKTILELARGNSPAHDWRRARHEAASSCKVMHAVLQGVREKAGKPTAAHHYINEARLVNWALAGEFVGIDRDTLTGDDLDLLAKLEERNTVLIGMAMPYADRKAELSAYAADLRNTRQLRLGEVA